MHENFHPDVVPEQRLHMLQNQADRTYKGEFYQRVLTEEELQNAREKFTDNSIKLSALEDELDLIKDSFKERMKPVKQENGELLTSIKTKQVEMKDDLYVIFNYDDREAITYNSAGDFIASRRLRPDEKQGGLYSLGKTEQQ